MAGSAHAQLDGVYVGAGVGLYKGSVELVDPTGPIDFTLSDDKHRAAFNLNGGYGHSFGNFHLAGEASYANEMGRITGSFFGNNLSAKIKNVWALSILPGYKFNNTTLAFVRLGYAHAKGDLSDIGDETFKGTLYGIGVKHAFNRNVSGVLEYQNLVTRSKSFDTTSVKPMSSGVLLGVQYGF